MSQRSILAFFISLLTVLLPVCAYAEHHSRMPVPPSLEIEILDPGVDPVGNPAVQVEKDPCSGEYKVDIPPTVLVHRFYYAGDRSFQGPMLPGGPSIVVVNHPKTGERCYIPVQMIPGAPVVTYTAKSIEYDFGERGISVVFCPVPGLGCPKVTYRNHQKCSTRVEEAIDKSCLPEVVGTVRTRTGDFVERSKVRLHDELVCGHCIAKRMCDPVCQAAGMLPFGNMVFSPNPEQASVVRAAEYARDIEVQRASAESLRAEASFPTLR